MRANGLSKLRPFAWSQPGSRGLLWSEATHPVDIPTPNCQGSALLIGSGVKYGLTSGLEPESGSASMSRSRTGLALFSNPSSASGRINMTVHATLDGFHTLLQPALVISAGPSAYSCLTEGTGGRSIGAAPALLASDWAGLLWEGSVDGCSGPSCGVYFYRVPLSTWSSAFSQK